MTNSSTADTREALIDVLDELSEDRMAEILDFALFLKGRQTRERANDLSRPVHHLEDLWGDFWPEDESVDDFIDTVRRRRCEESQDELEDSLLSQDTEFLARMRQARTHHLEAITRTLNDLKHEWCIKE